MSSSFKPGDALLAQPLDSLLASSAVQAQKVTGIGSTPQVVVSPYRFNPLGAHIDHQGGSVLARSLDQYTVLCFWPRSDALCAVHCNLGDTGWQRATFSAADLQDDHGWDAMARASAAAFSSMHKMHSGIDAVVFGTLISGGLSSSASVVLAYLTALAHVNDVSLSATELVELCRQVENDYRGLKNGIQDQMSIVFGQRNHLVLLDVENVVATPVADPGNINEVTFLMCYSGVSRDLVTGSNFNTRVAECAEAAALLSPGASHLGEVPGELRSEACLAALPAIQQRRARHVYGEMQRVQQGCLNWQNGDWQAFGKLMNESCSSSINNYESGSPWLIDLHSMASTIDGVYGSRFSGGGYGGCLFMLVDVKRAETVAQDLYSAYTDRYPELSGLARISVAQSESTVRVVAP